MRCKRNAYLLLMAGIAAMVSACGGGGGGPAIAPITVTAAKNPVLVGGSTTITANFANYTSTIKFGSTVNFGVSAPGVLSSATKTQAGGIATVTVSSPQAATVSISASSGNFAGSTTVSFIPLPATASVVISPPAAITSLGALSCNLMSDVPVTFSKYTSVSLNGSGISTVNPIVGSNNVSLITPGLVSPSGINVTPSSALFKVLFTVPSSALAVPNFSIDQNSVVAGFSSGTSITPKPVLIMKPTYYDSTGKVLFTIP